MDHPTPDVFIYHSHKGLAGTVMQLRKLYMDGWLNAPDLALIAQAAVMALELVTLDRKPTDGA